MTIPRTSDERRAALREGVADRLARRRRTAVREGLVAGVGVAVAVWLLRLALEPVGGPLNGLIWAGVTGVMAGLLVWWVARRLPARRVLARPQRTVELREQEREEPRHYPGWTPKPTLKEQMAARTDGRRRRQHIALFLIVLIGFGVVVALLLPALFAATVIAGLR